MKHNLRRSREGRNCVTAISVVFIYDQPLIVALQMGDADLADNERGAFWTFMAIYFGVASAVSRFGMTRAAFGPYSANALDLFLVASPRRRVESVSTYSRDGSSLGGSLDDKRRVICALRPTSLACLFCLSK